MMEFREITFLAGGPQVNAVVMRRGIFNLAKMKG